MTSTPTQVAVPVDAAAAAEVLVRAGAAGRTVRPLGSGHSFSAIGQPPDIAVSLAGLAGDLPLLVRGTRDEWDLLVDRRAWLNVRVVRNDDLAHTALPDAFQVLYESPLLAVDDVRQQQPLLESADRRWVVTPGPDRAAPAGFEAIDIHELFA